jgi:2-iminobutanoate/2-iminopropanoate deaminase
MGLQREIIAPKDPALGVPRNLDLPLSPAIRAGAFVFVSGLVAIDPATGERMHGTVATETRQILAAMTQVLEAADSSLEKVVMANVLIYSMLEYNNMNEVYREFFPVDPPARTVCGAQLSGGSKVEIECIALA